MPQGPYLRKYGVQTTIDFVLFEVDGVDFRVDAVHAAGDTTIMKDEGAEANTANGFTDEGNGYSIVLSATEMEAARIVIYVIDQTATKVWLDDSIVVETYGHASAMHAVDLDDSVRAGLTALPNAAADAVGGLPISDAGGLDMDNLKTELDGLQGTDGKCAISTDAQDLSSSLDVNTKAISGSTTAADNLEASAEVVVPGTVSHDNTAATTTVFYSDDITEATADHYNGRIVIFTSGALQYQATDITDYALVSGEGKFTVTALTEAPGDNVTFVIV